MRVLRVGAVRLLSVLVCDLALSWCTISFSFPCLVGTAPSFNCSGRANISHWDVELTARVFRVAIMGLFKSRPASPFYTCVCADDDERVKKNAWVIEIICCFCRVLTSKSVSCASLVVPTSDAWSWVKYVLVERGKTSLVPKVSLPTFRLRWFRVLYALGKIDLAQDRSPRLVAPNIFEDNGACQCVSSMTSPALYGCCENTTNQWPFVKVGIRNSVSSLKHVYSERGRFRRVSQCNVRVMGITPPSFSCRHMHWSECCDVNNCAPWTEKVGFLV